MAKVGISQLQIAPTEATRHCRLVLGELPLYLRPEDSSQVSAVEPPEACGQLEGPHVSRGFCARLLHDPNQQVNGRTKNCIQVLHAAGSGPRRLAKKAGDKANTELIDLVRLAVPSRCAARRLKNDRRQRRPRGGGEVWEPQSIYTHYL